MGVVSDRLCAMQSSGNKVVTLVSDTQSNQDCCKYFTKILKWVNFEYYKVFSSLTKAGAFRYADALISSGELLAAFKYHHKNAVINDALLVTLQECITWAAHFNAEGIKKSMRYAYIADTSAMGADKLQRVKGTPMYNCMILSDYPEEFNKYAVWVNESKVALDIVTKSEEDYEVYLCSTKLGNEEDIRS